MSPDAPLPPTETDCPSCGERILAVAKKCKHCGEWISSQPNPILAQQANYSVPLRIERQEQSGGGGGGGGSGGGGGGGGGSGGRGGGSNYSTSSIGIATQGSVCPQCKAATGFADTYSMWHWVLAILFFPLGLLCLLFPIKVCARCGTTFGAGVQMAKIVRIIAILYLSAILLIAVSCFGLIAVAGYTAAKAVDEVGETVDAALGTTRSAVGSTAEVPEPERQEPLDSSSQIPSMLTNHESDEYRAPPIDTGGDGARSGATQPFLTADRVAQQLKIVESLNPRPSEGGVYEESMVEKPVTEASNTQRPRFPDIFRSAGVEGEVLAQFVVDTTGRVEINSFKVIKTSHELFAASVRSALPGMRFHPAEVGLKRVRQLVQQPFVFAIAK